MPQSMLAHNVVQPHPRVSTHRVHGVIPPRPAEYQLLEERIHAI